MPIKLIFVFFLFSLVLYGCSQSPASSVEADYVFENVNVVPMYEENVHRDKAVAIKDGNIVAIVDQEEAHQIAANHRIDGRSRYLMPGLADMHVHVRWDPQVMFKLFLANGVTTVFNMGIVDGAGEIDHVQLRSDVAAGVVVGPRYLISGPQLHSNDLPDVGAVAPVLERHVEEQFNVVKVHGDLNPEVYDALIEGVRAQNLRITGHAQHLMPLSASMRMDALEHIEEFLYVSPDPAFAEAAKDNFLDAHRAHVQRLADPDLRARIVREVASTRIYVDPTLIVYRMVARWASSEHFADLAEDPYLDYLPAGVRNAWLNAKSNPYQNPDFEFSTREIESNVKTLSVLMRELHEAGVPLLLGTDSFGTLVPGFSVHQELELLVAAGLTPYQALRTGTINVAAYLNESEERGSIEVGKRADLIMLDNNPLSDIRNARGVRGLFTHGRWYSESALESFLEEARERMSQPE